MQVQLSPFEGPLDLLLQLIEQEEFDITTVALASVCERYLAHLKQVGDRSPEEVADFLLVAAKLLYLKSLALMPDAAAVDEEDATGLAEQLRLYRAFLDAANVVAARYAAPTRSFPIEQPRTITRPSFIPPPRCTADVLVLTIARIVDELEPIVRIPKAVIGRAISIDDRIAEIRELIASQPRATLADVLRGRVGRDQQIVSFLAILELYKQRLIDVQQAARFAPISIARIVPQASE